MQAEYFLIIWLKSSLALTVIPTPYPDLFACRLAQAAWISGKAWRYADCIPAPGPETVDAPKTDRR